jgi:hypothetical protein
MFDRPHHSQDSYEWHGTHGGILQVLNFRVFGKQETEIASGWSVIRPQYCEIQDQPQEDINGTMDIDQAKAADIDWTARGICFVKKSLTFSGEDSPDVESSIVCHGRVRSV